MRKSDVPKCTGPRLLGAALLAVLASVGAAARAGYTTIVSNGRSSNRVDMVFIGDGYTSSQLETLYPQHIFAMLNHMFIDEQPFDRYFSFFNIHRVNVASKQSGADVPPDGIFRDTALDATYYGDGTTARLLTIDDDKAEVAIHAALTGTGINPDIRIATVNDTRYGGSGGYYATIAGGVPDAGETVLHEIGHSFGGLADQYGGEESPYAGPEPTEPDVTTAPNGEKWQQWIGYDQPGIGLIDAYEGGAYFDHGIYRPSLDSKMRSLGNPFDAVGREQLVLQIYGLVRPLDGFLLPSGIINSTTPLWVSTVDPSVIELSWYIDGVLVPGATAETLDLSDYSVPSGIHQVTAVAADRTDWVRIDLDKLRQEITWTVRVVPEPATITLILVAAVGFCITWRRPAARA